MNRADSVKKTESMTIEEDRMQEYSNAFQFMDYDSDGKLSKNDIKHVYKVLGKDLSDKDLEKLYKDVSNPLEFPEYAAMMVRELSDVPDRSEILRALKVFSDEAEIDSNELLKHLKVSGLHKDEIVPVLKKFEKERMDGQKVFKGSEFLNTITK